MELRWHSSEGERELDRSAEFPRTYDRNAHNHTRFSPSSTKVKSTTIVEAARGEDNMQRRQLIAEAGVRLITRGGVRALTHRAVDREASLSPGSTSYYARTHRDLVMLVVKHLGTQTRTDLDSFSLPASLTASEAAALLTMLLDHLARRADEQSARFALLFEVRGDEELHALLTLDSPVRTLLAQGAESVLQVLGVENPSHYAADLVGLLDALMMYRLAGAAPVNARSVIQAYLDGLPRCNVT